MNCMKCGREVEFGRVFCRECLADMERYPVKPDTVVQLPPQAKEQTARKQPQRRRPALPPEEQVKHLRKEIHWLVAALIACAVLLAAMTFINGTLLSKLDEQNPLGKNYSAVVNTQPASATPPGAAE